jgi:hypothetical protein
MNYRSQPVDDGILRCPRCHETLRLADVVGSGGPMHECAACWGIFASESTVRSHVALANPENGELFFARLAQRQVGGPLLCPVRGCPDATMEMLFFGALPLDRCPRHGFWFDTNEFGTILVQGKPEAVRARELEETREAYARNMQLRGAQPLARRTREGAPLLELLREYFSFF